MSQGTSHDGPDRMGFAGTGRAIHRRVAIIALLFAAGPVRTQPAATPKNRTDLQADPLPAGAVARLGATRWRPGYCNWLRYSPDGKTIFTTLVNTRSLIYGHAETDIVRAWDRETGKEKERWELPRTGARCRIGAINLAADRVAFFRGPAVEVKSLKNGKVLFSVDDSTAESCALSPDGRRLAAWSPFRKTLTVWELSTRKKLWTFSTALKSEQAGFVVGGNLQFSPNGRFLTAAEPTEDQHARIFIWNLGNDKGQAGLNVNVNARWDTELVFSPDGKRLAWMDVFRVGLWHMKEKREQFLKTGFIPYTLAFSPDGRFLAVAGQKVELWDLTSARARPLADPPAPIHALAFSPDGRELAGSTHGAVCRWDVASSRLLPLPGKLTRPVWNVLIAPDRGQVFARSDDALIGWDWHTGQEIVYHHLADETGLKISPDGKTFAGLKGEQEVVCRDIASGRVTQKHAVGKAVWFFDFLPGRGGMAVVAADKKVHLFERDGEKTIPLPPYRKDEPGLNDNGKSRYAFSPDGRFTVIGSWDTGIFPVYHKRTMRAPIRDLFSGRAWPTVEISAGPYQSLEPVHALFSPSLHSAAIALAMVKQGQQGTCASFFYLMERASGRERFHFQAWDDLTTNALLATDGRLMACADQSDHHGKPITVWDAVSGRPVARFQQPNNVACLAFSPDGSKLVSGLVDSTVLVWDLSEARAQMAKEQKRQLGRAELDSLWSDLASENARTAFLAIHHLAAAPEQTVPYVRARLPLRPKISADDLKGWIADLGSDSFRKREKAVAQLYLQGAQAEAAVRKALVNPSSLEVRRRLEVLLKKLTQTIPRTGPELQSFRALEVLELAGTADAFAVLEQQAARAPRDWLAEEARWSLQRHRAERHSTRGTAR